MRMYFDKQPVTYCDDLLSFYRDTAVAVKRALREEVLFELCGLREYRVEAARTHIATMS